MPKPNNFPREGQHRTVTRDLLDRLEAGRAEPEFELDYTIGGPVETMVHSTVEAERAAAVSNGNRRMNEVDQQFDHDLTMATHDGLAQAQFNVQAERHVTIEHTVFVNDQVVEQTVTEYSEPVMDRLEPEHDTQIDKQAAELQQQQDQAATQDQGQER